MCGLFGLVSYGHSNTQTINKLVKALGKASETRGVDAGGISYIDLDNMKLDIRRNKGAISKNGVLDEVIKSSMIMGHTRLGTGASEKHNFNNHPFPSTKKPFAMAHNGIINNDWELEIDNNLPKSKVETDSYIVVRLLDTLYDGVLDSSTVVSVSEMLEGTFNLTFQDKESIWIVKHNNPIYITNIFELGVIVYASTKEIVLDALNTFYDLDFTGYLMGRSGDLYSSQTVLNSGDILRIMNDGTMQNFKFKPKPYSYKYTANYASYSNVFGYGKDFPTDDYYCGDSYFDDDAYERQMNALYGMYKGKKDDAVDYRVVDLYGGLAYLPKTYRALIFNGTDTEVTFLPWGAEGKQMVYSELLGKTIPINSDTSKALTLSNFESKLFSSPITKEHYKGIIDDANYVALLKTLSNIGVFKDVMETIKKTAYPNETKKMLKNLVAFHMYALYEFDLSVYAKDSAEISKYLMDELNKILEYALYSKMSLLYEYLQCSIEYSTQTYYEQCKSDTLKQVESEVF